MAKVKTTYEQVKEFHSVFGHPVAALPLSPGVKHIKFRTRFFLEETVELILALGARHPENAHLRRAVELLNAAREQIAQAKDYEFKDVDLVEVADALGDLDYITSGAALTFGIPLPEVVAEIHRSNMSKLGEDGLPIYDDEGKVVKGPNYEPPQLELLLFPEPEVEEDGA